jgi:ribosome-associated toxin RatA of RatAB toxin-antitoxin module
VWNIVADVDNEPKYWTGLENVNNIRKEGNVIEREVTVGGFWHFNAHQTVVLNPIKSVKVTMTEGPMTGTSVVKMSLLEDNKTKVDISWNFEPSPQVPAFAYVSMKKNIVETTEIALSRIAEETEQKTHINKLSSEQKVPIKKAATTRRRK